MTVAAITALATPIVAALAAAVGFLWRHGNKKEKAWALEREQAKQEIQQLHGQINVLHEKLLAVSEKRRKEQDATGEHLTALANSMESLLDCLQGDVRHDR